MGISRVLVKASPAFGRRRLLKKHGLFLFLPRVVLNIWKSSIVVVRAMEEEGVGAKFDLFFRGGAGIRI